MGLSTSHFIDLCAVSAREMQQLQSQVQQLEDTVLTVFENGNKPTSQDIKSLQDFDLVMQTLGGISNFFMQLHSQATEEGQADLTRATEAITLEKLRERLRETGEIASQ